MATQTGSIDLKAAKQANDEASKVATNYVADISNGILVHPENDTQNGVRITNKVDILRAGDSVMAVGETRDNTEIIRIGKCGETRAEINYHSMKLLDKEGNTYFWVSDPRDREGYFIETFIGDGSTTVFKINNTTDGGLVTVKINDVEVTNYTHVGSSNIFTFDEAPSINDVITIRYHASWTGASYGFTYGKRADNSYIGNGSAVFAGLGCVASGALAIASGSNSEATGPTSFARGRYAKAGGQYSHAEGDSVQTQRKCQTVIGEYNIIDTDVTGPSSSYGDIGRRGKYVLIIGNGMLPPGGESYRSNALTVDWDGNVVASGDVTDGNGNVLSDKADTTALADYLPLTGGTLTGALNGTDITASGDITSENAYLQLDTTATSGTDKEIYDALVSLGWTDVIV